MENLKIRVNSEAESKEAQELFFELGYKKNAKFTKEDFIGFDGWICALDDGSCDYCPTSHTDKEITLPELRDLVVLKRNDPKDATHYRNDGKEYFQTCDKERHYHFQDDAWVLSTWMNYQLLPQLKPIEKKEMKEYLRKNSNGTYSYIGPVHTDHVHDLMIEIPEGANFAWKSDGKYVFFTALEMGYRDAAVVWSRHTHPEELPFIDDEPLKVIDSEYSKDGNSVTHTVSLNNQYAEIEKVRQSAWQKQEDGSHYKALKIQPMQYALENKLDYAQANVVKYVTRHADKNGKEDLLKAIHNLELMIEFYYGDEK